jgi:hypothetical protein
MYVDESFDVALHCITGGIPTGTVVEDKDSWNLLAPTASAALQRDTVLADCDSNVIDAAMEMIGELA